MVAGAEADAEWMHDCIETTGVKVVAHGCRQHLREHLLLPDIISAGQDAAVRVIAGGGDLIDERHQLIADNGEHCGNSLAARAWFVLVEQRVVAIRLIADRICELLGEIDDLGQMRAERVEVVLLTRRGPGLIAQCRGT